VIVAKPMMKYKVYCKDEYVFVGYEVILWYFIYGQLFHITLVKGTDMEILKSKTKLIYCVFILFFLFVQIGCTSQSSVNSSVQQGLFKTKVLIPENADRVIYGNGSVYIDASNTAQGYIMMKYKKATDKKIKVQITKTQEETYTYNLPVDSTFCVLPLTQGDGVYKIVVYKNIQASEYTTVYEKKLSVQLENEFLPFLYPNQYVNFTVQSKAVQEAEELVTDAQDELDVVSIIYNYVVGALSYDYEKAKTVQAGYLPDVDEILEKKEGICFDYAALMCCMLRSLSIPTKLVIGYVGEIYHAWISVYITDIGWINNIIEFDGKNWKLMDPTFDSTSGSDKKVLKKINDSVDYIEKYAY